MERGRERDREREKSRAKGQIFIGKTKSIERAMNKERSQKLTYIYIYIRLHIYMYFQIYIMCVYEGIKVNHKKKALLLTIILS